MNTQPGIYGRKIGTTQLFEKDGTVTRVTVLEVGPVVVVGKRTPEKDGYTALILGFEDRAERHTNKPLAGYFKKASVTPKRMLKELRCDAEFAGKWEVGATMKIDEIFQTGMKKPLKDAANAQIRLGQAYLAAGQKAEAKAAFNKVKTPEKDAMVAHLWTLAAR